MSTRESLGRTESRSPAHSTSARKRAAPGTATSSASSSLACKKCRARKVKASLRSISPGLQTLTQNCSVMPLFRFALAALRLACHVLWQIIPHPETTLEVKSAPWRSVCVNSSLPLVIQKTHRLSVRRAGDGSARLSSPEMETR